MTSGRKDSKGRPGRSKEPSPARSKTALKLRRVGGQAAWELAHPACCTERADDLAEVHAMLAAGEVDVARDELIWLLEGCRDFVAAHKLLGELAAAEDDLRLARAHFGYAWQIGMAAMPAAGLKEPLPYSQPANQAFLESGKGLAWCLKELGHAEQFQEVARQMLACDPSDPLGMAEMLRA